MKIILIVDDNEEVVEILATLAKLKNYNVLTANNGFDALVMFADKQQIDLIILDKNMPGMSGIETYKYIRTMNKTIPVIFISGDSLDMYNDQYDSDTYMVQKPFNVNKLFALIESALNKSL